MGFLFLPFKGVQYQLKELANESGKQQKLSSFFSHKSIPRSTDADNIEDSHIEVDREGMDANKLVMSGKGNFSTCKRQHDDESVSLGQESVSKEGNAEVKFTGLEDEQSAVEASDSSPCQIPEMVNSTKNNIFSTTKFHGTSNKPHSTLEDPNFVENYFKVDN